nr:hypothetical protein [Tanacetum cinerariifolium]
MSTAKLTFTADLGNKGKAGNFQNKIDDKGYWDSGCSRYMTGNISYLSEYEPYDGGYVSFGQEGGKITGKDFKLKDDTNVLLRTPRQHNMYSIDLNNVIRHKNLTCLVAKAFVDEKMNEFCTKKGIKREFSNARTPQQNGIAERMNRTLIEATRTIPFGCHVMILNTLDHLGKFDAKGDECYFVGYSMSSKAFRVFNKRTKKVEENMHVDFLENKLIEKGVGPNWLFDIDTLTNSMNYVPVVVAGASFTNISGTKDVASQVLKKDVSSLRYIALLNWFHEAHMESSNSDAQDACNADIPKSSGISNPTTTLKIPLADQMESLTVEYEIPTVSSPVSTVCLDISPEPSSGSRHISKGVLSQEETPSLDNDLTLSNWFEDTIRVEADLSNMESSIPASLTVTFKIHKEEPKKIFNTLKEPSWVESMQEELLQFKIQNVWILVDCPKGIRPIGTKWVLKNKKDERGIVIRNKARLMDVKSAFLYGTIDEEVYVMQPPRFQDLEFPDKVYKVEKSMYGLHQAPRAWYVYQMDVKSAFLYGTIDEEVYVMQPPRFQDLEFPDKVYKVEKAMYGLHQAPRAWYVYVDDIIFGSSNLQFCREFEALMHDKFQMSGMGELTFFLGLQVLQKNDDIFLSQDKYVGDILKKFGYSDVRSANTPMDKENPWGKDRPSKDVELHLYRYMIRSLMYHTASRPDIMFATIVATSTTEAEYVAAASGCRQVLWIQNQMLDYGLTFCDYHNMIAILEKTEHNIDFHKILDFLEASHIRDDSQGEAFPTASSLDAGQDRENIIKTSALPYESSPRVTSLDADEGTQDLEISSLKVRVKFLEDKDRGRAKPSQEDAPIKWGNMKIGEEVRVESSTKLGSNDTEEMVNVLSSMETVNILTSEVAAVSVSSVAAATTVGVPNTTRGIYAKGKGKEKVVESEVPKKRKLQEQIDAQVVKEIEEDFARENQRLNEQIARDSEIARLHAEVELKMMIEGLDRSNETKHFRGMALEEIKEKFIPVWKQLKDFVHMSSKEESERVERQGSSKMMKTSKSASKGVSKEELKEMMQLVPLEEVIKQATKDKEKELWVELKRLFEPDFEDQLWTYNQNFMHNPLEWKLYDTCGVHHVFTKDQEIFMLVEKDYPLRKRLATLMICNKLQVEQYSQMANDLILKIHNIVNSPR